MRVAVSFNVWGDPRNIPYIHACHGALIRVMLVPHIGIEVVKYGITVGKEGIRIGAVGYPYPENSAIALEECKAMKLAHLVWNYVLDDSDQPVEVVYNNQKRKYLDADGNPYNSMEVMHMYFDGDVLRRSEDSSRPSQIGVPAAYINWMKGVARQMVSRHIDSNHITGRDMINVVEHIYNSEHPAGRSFKMPEFFLKTASPLGIRREVVESSLLSEARFDNGDFDCEYSPVYGALVECDETDSDITLRIRVAKEIMSEEEDGVFLATDEIVSLRFPSQNAQATVFPNICDVKEGDQIDNDNLITPFSRIIRLLPTNRGYKNIAELKSKAGDTLIQFLSDQVVSQLQPSYGNNILCNLKLLDKLPDNLHPDRDLFMRNRRCTSLVECSPDDLVCQFDRFIRMDLRHHTWYDRNMQAVNNRLKSRVSSYY